MILVVDDSRSNRAFLRDMLRSAGYQVINAATGEEALDLLQADDAHEIWPDLILLDVILPGIDGFETCRRLKARKETQDIFVVFMTSLTETTDKVKGLSLGAVDYITKPLQPEEVKARISVHLQLRHLTKTLEQQVIDRTADLQQAVDNLKRMQMQLIQSEKMSALGQLVSGVAHEINNPVGCVAGNIKPAQGYVQDLLEIIDLLLAQPSEPSAEVSQLLEDLDFDFIREDLPKLLGSMKLGADRIQEIVKSLRNFSRLDEDQKKPADLHTGLESTLMILKHRLKAKPERDAITIVRNYGDLPKVHCYASQLNQVFMNILGNAIDAIDETFAEAPGQSLQERITTNAQYQGQIVITTHCGGQWVTVQIEDNGYGVKAEAANKLFDPFFTTKSSDRGTGLGLSISHHIVADKHGGTLDYQSCTQAGVAQGTCFTIHIPVNAEPENLPQAHHSPYEVLAKS
ncbi:response regulator receiver protein [Prochlorothrix hollandica PCC 9006 = CALU 1027]|uniref:histidine kinase n=1 Tax=Prochlorothrix hollandica PCC 9006 = CALU 1027 TaxID=317619 RepID=A0A0M2PVS2_PROHO|nr:response regulator receiver protein [Prochlorothrix hollandica PCC 9006 = CALU 1027]